jgi:predicted nucleic acid-binding Zn ribbon protein
MSHPDELRSIENIYQQRRPKIRPPQKMADALSNLLAKRGYGRVLATGALDDAWQAACGERFAGDTRPGNVRRGILEVVVRNSAVLHELTFVKKKLIEKLQTTAPEQKIRDLRLKVGVIE